MDYDSVFGSDSHMENKTQIEDGEISMRDVADVSIDEDEKESRNWIKFLSRPFLICMSDQRRNWIINWFDQIRPSSYFKLLFFSLVATLIFQPLAERNKSAFFMDCGLLSFYLDVRVIIHGENPPEINVSPSAYIFNFYGHLYCFRFQFR